ncbi:MAG TPA: TIGR00730 family Rossman fold protein [Mycobacteriales bacterium]|nr:TIGR00730 family Rossman fold protein [Mycobacteriales bacterium]
MRSVCVFCGSSPGADPAFEAAANALGDALARRGLRLVYGGGNVGLMGTVANAAINAGGEVLGVITRALEAKELAHHGLTELLAVDTMHERKAAMADASDCFVMLPGGFGTLDEFFEALTWTQLGVHAKPCGILDVNHYFDPLRVFLDLAVEKRFVRAEHRAMIVDETDPEVLLNKLAAWQPEHLDKWLDRSDR